jgi:hypothetical protein
MKSKSRQVAHILKGGTWKNYPYKINDRVIAINNSPNTGAEGHYKKGWLGIVLKNPDCEEIDIKFDKGVNEWRTFIENIRPYDN